jgi:hypothetical protein
MAVRLILATVLGGIVMFAWGAFAHMVLQLGDSTLKSIPNEALVAKAMEENIKEPGVYFFPWTDHSKGGTTEEQTKAWKEFEEKYRTMPHGLLIYSLPGGEVMTPGQLIRQFLFDLLCAFIAAILLAGAAPGLRSYIYRVAFVTMLGFLSAVAVLLPYWNWYDFPLDWVRDGIAEQTLGFFLAGLVIALFIRPQPAPTPAPAA